MTVICLLVILIGELYFSHITSKGVLLTPHFGFALSFIPQVMLACFYIAKWDLDLEIGTIMVISGGVFLFSIVSFLFCGKRPRQLIRSGVEHNTNEAGIEVDTWKLILMIAIQTGTILLCVKYLLSLSSGVSLGEAILYYRYTNLFAEDSFVIPSFVRMLRTFCVSSGFVFTYLLIHSYNYKDKVEKKFLLFNILLSVVNDVIFGARTGIAILGIAAVVQYYFIRGKKVGWRRAMPFKTLLKIVIGGFIFLGLFQAIAELMGRTLASDYTFMDYIAGYLSAELRNLNSFIRIGKFGSTINNNQTLNGIIPFLSKVFGHPEWIHKLDLPFIIEGGYNYGNVYTIFYAFIYDMGYGGLFVYIPIMAIFCAWMYKKVLKERIDNKISVNIIVYSYVYYTIIFSFFSDKFYETVVNTKFVWTIVSWLVLSWFFKLKIKIGKG